VLSLIAMAPKSPLAHTRFSPSHRVLSRFTIAAPNRRKCLVFRANASSLANFPRHSRDQVNSRAPRRQRAAGFELEQSVPSAKGGGA